MWCHDAIARYDLMRMDIDGACIRVSGRLKRLTTVYRTVYRLYIEMGKSFNGK